MSDPKVEPGKTELPEEKKAAGNRTCGAMHDNVEEWMDPVCSCEAEPYWQESEEGFGQKQETPE